MKLFKEKENIVVAKVLFIEERFIYLCYEICKEAEEFEILKKDAHITTSLTSFKKYVKKRPLIVIFSGDNVLYSENRELFKSSDENFYRTYYKNEEDKEFVALVRKEQVDFMLDVLLEENFLIVDVYIGVLVLSLLSEKYIQKNKVIIDGVELSFNEENCLQNIFVNEEKEKVNEEGLVLSSVLNTFYPSGNIVNICKNNLLEVNREELENKIKFTFLSKVGFFSLLLIATIVYSIGQYFVVKNKQIETQMHSDVNKRKKLISLKKEERRKEEMLKLSGFYQSNLLSFYIDALVKILPQGITLSKIDIFPLEKKTQKNKKIQMKDGVILIKGFFLEVSEFNSWIFKMKKEINIEKVSILEYEKEKEGTSFELQILLK
ncbi:hypothetical protein [Tenacibaculum maritimum]|uniref:hypothetical protein n=2 Tax=Tenacibaculum maritimum TaxID=107401 RepID=UPI003875DDE2